MYLAILFLYNKRWYSSFNVDNPEKELLPVIGYTTRGRWIWPVVAITACTSFQGCFFPLDQSPGPSDIMNELRDLQEIQYRLYFILKEELNSLTAISMHRNEYFL